MKKEQLKKTKTRVTADDARRCQLYTEELHSYVRLYQPSVIGVEAYILNSFQKRGETGAAFNVGNAGNKTMLMYGATLAYGVTQGIQTHVFIPSDLKRRFAQGKSTSKGSVQKGVCAEVCELEDLIKATTKSAKTQSHLADAAGHAILALEATIERMK